MDMKVHGLLKKLADEIHHLPTRINNQREATLNDFDSFARSPHTCLLCLHLFVYVFAIVLVHLKF